MPQAPPCGALQTTPPDSRSTTSSSTRTSHRAPPYDETIRRYANLVTAPGEKVEYSNLGYGIPRYVISRISGKDYGDFMREEVFGPRGLTHTSVNIGPRLQQQQAPRYGREGVPTPPYVTDHPGASEIYSSAHDLLRFVLFHLKTRLLDQKAILSENLWNSWPENTATNSTNERELNSFAKRAGPFALLSPRTIWT